MVRPCIGRHCVSSGRLATVVWLTYCAGWSLSRSYCGEWDSNTHWGLNCSAERIPRRRWFWRDVVVTIVGAGGRKIKGIKGQPDDCSTLVRVASLFGTPYLSLRDPSQKESKSLKGSSREASNDPLALFAALLTLKPFLLGNMSCVCSWCEIYTWHMRWIADPMISLSNNRCDSEIKNTYCTSISAFWMFFRCSIWHGSGQPTSGYKRSLPRKQESWKQQKRTVLLFPHAQRVAICM